MPKNNPKTNPVKLAYLAARRQASFDAGLCVGCKLRPYEERKKTCIECQNDRKRRFYQEAYNLTPEQIEVRRLKQDNECVICQKKFESTPHVDHSAITLVFRGLLCSKCNTMIGLAEENIEILANAREYLILYGANDPHYQRAYQSRLSETKNPFDWAARDGENDIYGNCPESWCGDM